MTIYRLESINVMSLQKNNSYSTNNQLDRIISIIQAIATRAFDCLAGVFSIIYHFLVDFYQRHVQKKDEINHLLSSSCDKNLMQTPKYQVINILTQPHSAAYKRFIDKCSIKIPCSPLEEEFPENYKIKFSPKAMKEILSGIRGDLGRQSPPIINGVCSYNSFQSDGRKNSEIVDRALENILSKLGLVLNAEKTDLVGEYHPYIPGILNYCWQAGYAIPLHLFQHTIRNFFHKDYYPNTVGHYSYTINHWDIDNPEKVEIVVTSKMQVVFQFQNCYKLEGEHLYQSELISTYYNSAPILDLAAKITKDHVELVWKLAESK